MRIGIQQTAVGQGSLVECFARAQQVGAKGIGLCYRTAPEARQLGDCRHISEIRSLIGRFEMSVTGLYLGVLCAEQSLISDQSSTRHAQDIVRQAIGVSDAIGRPDVIIPFHGRNRIELPKEFDAACATISDLATAAENHGVMLAVESSLHLSQLQQFLSGSGSDFVKACLDTGDVTACRHDPVSMIIALGAEHIAQVHLKDASVVAGLPPDFNVRLGRGDVEFAGIASALERIGYGGWLVLETPRGDERGAIAAAHIDYARTLFGLAKPASAVTAAPDEPLSANGRVT